MASVDFITDEGFRASLEGDLRELHSALEIGNLKSAHVLAGSIVEAVLIDHLIVANLATMEEGLKLDLAEVIKRCKTHAIISERTADMSSVVRSFRNLIHPGRVLRLKERLTPDTANVARGLVMIVLDEVAAVRKQNFGLTAAQILAKLERDSNVEVLIPHLLKDANQHELKRLMMQALPGLIVKLNTEQYFLLEHIRGAATSCFRKALELSNPEIRKQVVTAFAKMVREESGSAIDEYCNLFFRAPDLEYLSAPDQALVRDYLLGRMNSNLDGALIRVVSGFSQFLTKDEASRFVDPLVRAATRPRASLTVAALTDFLGQQIFFSSKEFDAAAKARLQTWKEMAMGRGDTNRVKVIESLLSAVDDIPF